MKLHPNATILFQGDSITDAGRTKDDADQMPPANNIHALGAGYAAKAAGKLLAGYPGHNLQIFNRGISGNRVTDLWNRWQSGFEIIKPDLVSILIGVNDTWHGAAKGTPENGTTPETYERVYRELLDRLKQNFPDVKLVICEPFALECGAVLELNFHPDIEERRERAKKVADDYADVWVPFQQMFDELCHLAPPSHWAADGVHPSPAGHEKMAEFWIQKVLTDA
jgi:lysophospholipase L1-like esterase